MNKFSIVFLMFYMGCFNYKYIEALINCECDLAHCRKNGGICQASTTCFREYLQKSPEEPMQLLSKGCVVESRSIVCDPYFVMPSGKGPRLYMECCRENFCNRPNDLSKLNLAKYIKRQNQLDRKVLKSFQKSFKKKQENSSKQNKKILNSNLLDNSESSLLSSASSSSSSSFQFHYPVTLIIIIASIISATIFIILIVVIVKMIILYTQIIPSSNLYIPTKFHYPTTTIKTTPISKLDLYRASTISTTNGTTTTYPLIMESDPIYSVSLSSTSGYCGPASSASSASSSSSSTYQDPSNHTINSSKYIINDNNYSCKQTKNNSKFYRKFFQIFSKNGNNNNNDNNNSNNNNNNNNKSCYYKDHVFIA